MKTTSATFKNIHQKNIAKIFNELCYSHSRWDVWSDFITISAFAIVNRFDTNNYDKREKRVIKIQKNYSKSENEKFANMFAEIVLALDENPNQDFLGEMFMALELGNDHKGQFFTPYSVGRAMAEMNTYNANQNIEDKGWISVNDCACGAGCLLLAFANACRDSKINYQNHVLFIAQDLDFIASMMCYIQLSLLGCAGYVVIGDSLSNPVQSVDREGLIPVSSENTFCTPMFYSEVWNYRRIWHNMDLFMFGEKAK